MIVLLVTLGVGLLTAAGAALCAVAAGSAAPAAGSGAVVLARGRGVPDLRRAGGSRQSEAGRSRVAVIPCPEAAACYRWTIVTGAGDRLEISGYAYASPRGAADVGAIRLREAYPVR